MHLNKIALSIFLFVAIQALFAQEKKISIYYEGDGYLQPYITSTIDSLKSNKTNDYLFRTTSLNQLKLQNKIESEKGKLLQIYFNPENNNFNLTDSEKEGMRAINNQISNSNYLLIVKTITLVELIEFQFQLFIPKDNQKNSLNIANIKRISTQDLFINPKNELYKKDIKNALQRLFQESNFTPIAELFYLEKKINTNDTIIIPLNTNVILDGSNSGDFETENLIYKWRNITPKNRKIQTTNRIKFESNKGKQNISLTKEGRYKIGFNVYDNVTNSKEILLNIKTIPKINKVITVDSMVKSYYHNSIIDEIFNQRKLLRKESAQVLILNDSILNNKIFITKKPISKINSNSKELKPLEINEKRKINITSLFSFSSKSNYYLYQKDSLDFLSEPTKIIYSSQGFSIFSFGVKTSFNLIESGKEQDSLYLQRTFSTQSIIANLAISNNLELSTAIPLNTKEIDIFDRIILFPADWSLSINYIYRYKLLKNVKANIGLGYSSYSENIIENNEVIRQSNELNSIDFSIGTDFKLFSSKLFKVDFHFDTSFSNFSNDFKKVGFQNFSLGIFFRPKILSLYD